MGRRRYTPKDIRTRDVPLPEHLAKLGPAKYSALIVERHQETTKWFVELSSLSYARLMKVASASNEKQAEMRARADLYLARCTELERQLQDAKSEHANLLKKHHEFVKTVVAEDGRIRVPRSPKNYLQVAEDKGTKFGSPAIQGGLAGLEKK